jgi:hydroxymethylbilane synthase
MLRAHHPEIAVEIVVIRTAGDKNRHDPFSQFGGKGIFVKEIEDALLLQDIDLAVHSMKDMPTALPAGLHFGAIPRRGEVRDAYVGRDQRRLTERHSLWRVGTGSQRRQAQLRARYPDLHIQNIRGNVETRLRKMQQGEVDGLILAAAGLIRLGLQQEITELLPPEVMLPAPGQGALAVETLAGHWIDALLAPVHDPPTAGAVMAERAFLAHLGGGCTVPIAAFAQCEAHTLHLQGLVSSPDGCRVLRRALRGPVQEAAQLGQALADHLRAEGAGAILAAVS